MIQALFQLFERAEMEDWMRVQKEPQEERVGLLWVTYIGKPEISVRKSNVWRLQKIWAVIWGDATFLFFWISLADVDMVYSDSLRKVLRLAAHYLRSLKLIFYPETHEVDLWQVYDSVSPNVAFTCNCLMFMPKIFNRMVFVNDYHPPPPRGGGNLVWNRRRCSSSRLGV